MKVERKRIFISDLPETIAEDDIKSAFQNYGTVLSAEIKTRREIGPKNNSLHFAYVSIEIDDKTLQQCFRQFANKKWFGQNIILQVAKESFLDRLKKEREENTTNKRKNDNTQIIPQERIKENTSNGNIKKYKSESEIDTDEDSVKYVATSKSHKPGKYIKTTVLNNDLYSNSTSNGTELFDSENSDGLIIKNNKGKILGKYGLKIESVGNEAVLKSDKSNKAIFNSSESNLKRLQSVNNLKKDYQMRKSIIQEALSRVDSGPKNKIIFNDTEEGNRSSKRHLFEEDQSEDEEAKINFEVKRHFQGKDGEKLLALQSKYKSDKRFVLDSRFVENDEENNKAGNTEENELDDLGEEKQKEYEILEQVLGKKVSKPVRNDSERTVKAMLRFDPSQPDHSKFEIQNGVRKEKKRKRDKSVAEALSKKKEEEKEVPVVSADKFYKVTDNLKEVLHEKQEFSLLGTFGKADYKDLEQTGIAEKTSSLIATNKFMKEQNPFRYDSSDDEDETSAIPNQEQSTKSSDNLSREANISKNAYWSEPFFFKHDDYRLQEGFDFIEKMRTEEKTEFAKLRRDLKEIVKAKVRNVQRKNRPFKKKLGGSKRKKMIRMKKALKR